jgi:hypothetical protein
MRHGPPVATWSLPSSSDTALPIAVVAPVEHVDGEDRPADRRSRTPEGRSHRMHWLRLPVALSALELIQRALRHGAEEVQCRGIGEEPERSPGAASGVTRAVSRIGRCSLPRRTGTLSGHGAASPPRRVNPPRPRATPTRTAASCNSLPIEQPRARRRQCRNPREGESALVRSPQTICRAVGGAGRGSVVRYGSLVPRRMQ